MKRNARVVAAMTAALTLLSGCAGIGSIDELYSLPQPQEEFLQLQELINEEIEAGCEYSAPTAGSQRQSIQLVDIDGNGMEEALAFLRTTEETPKICVYRNVNGVYESACTITGEGTGIGRVEYADLNGDGFMELVVSWIMTSDLKLVKSYSLKDWTSAVMLLQSCTDFLVGDMNSDGRADVAVLNFEDESGNVSVFSADIAGEVTQSSASVSVSLTTADRFRISTIQNNTPAVFVEGHYGSTETGVWYLTDVFVMSDGALKNITQDAQTLNSTAKRPYAVYSYDINSDGALEIPSAEKTFAQNGVIAQYYVFDWFGYDAQGVGTKVLSTYHCYNDGWYLVLPEQWREGFTVRRETDPTGERSVTISQLEENTGTVRDMLTVYTLTDENRAEKAELTGRFVLFSNDTAIYAAKFDNKPSTFITDEQKQEIIDGFHLIFSEWNTGAV
ncbi:MAG: VCBS repeat-containing protein [Clostridia bacterium]|nr:VCBS repeat-containing protein [Clostridia bacterium]